MIPRDTLYFLIFTKLFFMRFHLILLPTHFEVRKNYCLCFTEEDTVVIVDGASGIPCHLSLFRF